MCILILQLPQLQYLLDITAMYVIRCIIPSCTQTLPPDERCDIPFPEGGTIMPMGKVSHLAEKLVVIQSLPGTPPFDEGTVLWTKEKKSIAKVNRGTAALH